MGIAEFIQSYGQPVAQGLFILILLSLLLYMLIVRPKATCCSVTHARRGDVKFEERSLENSVKPDETNSVLK